MRFNPPPNWPPAPTGWVPDPSWQPDPAWGPVPPGWPLWLPDDAPGPPPAARSRKALWLTLAGVGAVLVLAIGAVVVVGRGGGAEQKPSTKPDITTLAEEMLVDRSAFPDLGADAIWINSLDSSDDKTFGPPHDMSFSPSECADLLGEPAASEQVADAVLSRFGVDSMQAFEVMLSVAPEPLPLADYLGRCREFTIVNQSAGQRQEGHATVEPLRIDGAPPWSLGYTVRVTAPSAATGGTNHLTARVLAGYYRGVLVEAMDRRQTATDAEPETDDRVLDLFTAQVDRLEAAP
ncbi:hypothetical protein [Mycobacterium sp. 1274756.6]|uniref:hypothetical protein n=1 Tax=Mycobacterium sp. 1274756.6 TaxID=1834076 RepID=UPI0007FD4A8A|nr:hypothetical protein [Mycobacterium sp. 1274756.6]OBJ72177.1 hypothetical protein A5643_06155 [Mycobacterium sp. 1274756.6]